MPSDSKDLKKIEKALSKISDQQDEILGRLDRLEATGSPKAALSHDELIRFIR